MSVKRAAESESFMQRKKRGKGDFHFKIKELGDEAEESDEDQSLPPDWLLCHQCKAVADAETIKRNPTLWYCDCEVVNRERTLEDYGIKSFRGELFCSRQCHRENLEGKMPKQLSPELRTLLEESLETHKQQVFSLLIWESANCLLYTSPSPRDQRG